MVVLFHVGTGLVEEFPDRYNIFHFGYSGVDIFFVLSGYIMAHTTIVHRGAVDFMFRRLARIAPLYWFLTLALFLLALAAPQLLNTTKADFVHLLKSMVFIPYLKSNGAIQPMLFLGWTLCYEMFFYAVYALAIVVSRRVPGLSEKLLASIILFSCVQIGWIVQPGGALGRFYTNPLLIEFIFGIAIQVLSARYTGILRGAIAAAACFAVALLCFFALAGESRYLSLGIPSAFIVLGFVTLPPFESKVAQALEIAGNASYSLYLIHPYAIQLPVKLLSKGQDFSIVTAGALGGALAAIVVAFGFFYFLERPAQKVMYAWLTKMRGSGVGALRRFDRATS